MIKQLLPVFDLKVAEQRVVIFVLCAVVACVAIKTCREAATEAEVVAPISATDQPSPNPGIRP